MSLRDRNEVSVDSETTGVESARQLMFYSRVAHGPTSLFHPVSLHSSAEPARVGLFHTPKLRENG